MRTFCQLIDEVESRLPELFAEWCLVSKPQLMRAFPEVEPEDLDDAITCLCDEGKLVGHLQDHPGLYEQSIFDSTHRVYYAGVARGPNY